MPILSIGAKGTAPPLQTKFLAKKELLIWGLDFKQQHFHILARIYIYSGWNIHIFWPEYTYILDGIYTPYFSPYNTHIFWPEYTYILAGIYIYSGWNIQLQSIDSNIVE